MEVVHRIKTIAPSNIQQHLKLPRKLVNGESLLIRGTLTALNYRADEFVGLETFKWIHIIHTVINIKNDRILITEYFHDRLEGFSLPNLSDEGC